MADEWDEPDAPAAAPSEDTDLAFLKPGRKRAAKDEWDAVDDEVPSEDVVESRPLKNTGADLAVTMKTEADDFREANRPRSLGERAAATATGIKDTFVGGAKAVGGALPESLGGRGFLNTIEDPHHRREFERGLSDMITLGYAEKAGNAVSRFATAPVTADDNMAARVIKKTGGALGLTRPEDDLESNAIADKDNAPFDRSLGQAVGMAAPGAGSYIAKSTGNAIAPVLGGLNATTRVGGVALGAAKGVAGYEAAAPITAGLSAGAEGHRLDAAADAATDPVGLATSAIGGAVAEPVAKNLVGEARSRATHDIASDIVAADGHKAKRTDQLRIADVNDRIFQMTKDNPELRSIWREPAKDAVPKIEAIKQRIAEPLDAHYQALDEHTGGGITLGEIVDGYRNKAAELEKKRVGIEDADRLKALANQELRAAAARQGQRVEFDPKFKINTEGTTAGDQIAMLEKSAAISARSGNTAAADQLAEEIAKVREMASKPVGIDMNEKIPTKDFRENVTGLHKTADSVLGSIEGTPRHEALQRLYESGKEILDKHIDDSGLPKSSVESLRKINDQYFLLSRAQEAIKSRGISESNRPPISSILHSPRKLLHSGALPAIGAALAFPHARAELAATAIAGIAAPAVASRVNWRLAQIDPTRAAEVANSVGTGIGSTTGRVVGPQVAQQSNDRAIAQLIQGAQAGGDPDELAKRAAAFGVNPVMAQAIIRKWAPQPTQGVSP